MRNEKRFFCILLLFFCLEISRGQNNNQKTQVNVGVVTDVSTSYSEVAMLCINMSLVDFYSSRPQFQTRLVVGDSKKDVVGAASAGEEPFNIDGFGFVFPIGSPMVPDVSRAILKVAESPKAMELERAWFKKKEESCPDPVTNPDPNPSFTSRQLGVDSFWLLFLVVFVLCILTLGKFTVSLLWKTKWNDLTWEEFQRPDNDSYINNVEKCPCSSSRHMPENISQAMN